MDDSGATMESRQAGEVGVQRRGKVSLAGELDVEMKRSRWI